MQYPENVGASQTMDATGGNCPICGEYFNSRVKKSFTHKCDKNILAQIEWQEQIEIVLGEVPQI